MTKKSFYITTPIYYPSAKLHIGHAYSTTLADAMARFKRRLGYDVFFLTGSDEHGQKIQQKAQEAGIEPLTYVDKIVAGFQGLWQKLHISNDDFLRTTQKRHERVVQEIFRRIYEKGDIYRGKYKGLYCSPCESYWTEHQLADGKCPDCGREVAEVEEDAYFFKMSRYERRILEYIKSHPDFIRPRSRRNEMINFIKQGLEDLCISRTSFDWGIPLPIAPDHVIYVWFDALTNYLTPIGFLDDAAKFNKYWPADVHLVGKEIVRFHSIIWPAILMALDLPLPKLIYGHGWLIVDGEKMSKSKGNVIDPLKLIEEFGADAIRYFLLREINPAQDGNFSRDALITRINADLANDLGNLLHRTLNMIGKFQGGIVEKAHGESAIDQAFLADAEKAISAYEQEMASMQLQSAIKTVWAFISRANKYIDETMPWALFKDAKKKQTLNNTLYHLAESLRRISVLIEPFMPQTATKIWHQLGLLEDFADVRFNDVRSWGGFLAGTKVAKPEQLFPRIEVDKEPMYVADKKNISDKKLPREQKKPMKKQNPTAAVEGVVTIDEFSRINLRVAKILTAKRVAGTEKLMQLKVTLNDEEREIVSGIAQFYQADELVGKKVVLVENLKPAKIRGIRSHGMVLCALENDRLYLIEPDAPVGSKVK